MQTVHKVKMVTKAFVGRKLVLAYKAHKADMGTMAHKDFEDGKEYEVLMGYSVKEGFKELPVHKGGKVELDFKVHQVQMEHKVGKAGKEAQ